LGEVDTMVASLRVGVDEAAGAGSPKVRRRWSEETKRRLVALTYAPGASVAEIARRHGVNDNLLFTWRRRIGAERRALASPPPPVSFARVDVVADAAGGSAPRRPGLIEIELRGGACVRVDCEVSEPALVQVLSALKAVW
jgi:transposase